MRLFRRVILPTGFLVVFLVIAIALAWMAFRPAEASGSDSFGPTGDLIDSAVVVERVTIENTVALEGTVSRDPATPAPAPASGVVNYLYVSPGDTVAAGAELYQVRSDGEAPEPAPSAPGEGSGDDAASDEADEASAPARPVFRTVRAEEGGVVEPFDVKLNDDVSRGDAVVSVRPETYTASASVEPALLYRLLDPPEKASVEVDKGPEPFDCTRLRVGDGGSSRSGSTPAPAEGDAEAPPESGASGSAEARCTVPDDVRVFDGLALTMTIDAGSAEDVLAVPVTAVRGQTEQGSVWLVDETGEGTETRVELGLNDGTMVEVKSGVDEGAEILEFVPGSEPEDPYSDEFGYSEDYGYTEEDAYVDEGSGL